MEGEDCNLNLALKVSDAKAYHVARTRRTKPKGDHKSWEKGRPIRIVIHGPHSRVWARGQVQDPTLNRHLSSRVKAGKCVHKKNDRDEGILVN